MTTNNFDIEIIKDPTIFEQNRLKAVSDHKFYLTKAEALAEYSSLVRDLNGMWRFHYAKNLSLRPVGFEKDDYDISAFDSIKVPGHFQTQGYGVPQYTNKVYPWECQENVNPGEIPQIFNPVGSYVTTFDLDEVKDNLFICFEGVESAFALWLNGHYVGYSEDSFTPSSFDLSKYQREGQNRLCVQVFTYSSGSHLEDQDFWRLSGIFRDVYLYTKPKLHLNDYFIKTKLSDNYTKAIVTLEPKFEATKDGMVVLKVFDKDNKLVFETTKELNDESISFEIDKPDLWSAEKPNLYHFEMTLLDCCKDHEFILEYFGVREFAMQDTLMKINGQRIIFKGVNRHEFSAVNGRAITKEEILKDLLLIKAQNINAIRTCHYPNNSYFYKLCDKLGLYVIDETNLETHGYWQKLGLVDVYNENTIPDGHAKWHDAVLARGQAMLERDKNHPCVIIWSCGNESFGGQTLFDLSNYFRNSDPSRLVHYEGIFHDRRFNGTSDMESQMYTRVADVRAFLAEHKDKPFIMCEYTHSMGNSNGGMNLYTDMAKERGLYQGGFIWDFADQAFKAKTENGTDYLAYGGDFGDRPTDYNFSGNGIVFADRELSPKLKAVKYNYQSFEVNVSKDFVEIENFNLFTNLNEYETFLVILKNGVKVEELSLGQLTLEPDSKSKFALPYNQKLIDDKHEFTFEVSIRLKTETAYAKKGYEIAYGQYVFGDFVEETKTPSLKLELTGVPVNYAIVGDNFRFIFNNERGSLVSIKRGDKELLKAPTTINFWRAPNDNDIGWQMPHKLGIWKVAGMYAKLVKFAATKQDNCVVVTYTHELCTNPVATVDTVYTVDNTGKLNVKMSYKKVEGLPCIPDFGLIFKLYSTMDKLKYYGLGPCDNYCDREQGAKLGIFESDVASEYVPYLKPQECGNHGGIRYFNVTNTLGLGVSFKSATKDLNVSALPYTPCELENALHSYELPNTQTTVIKVSKRPMGVAGDDSWGSGPLDEFINQNESLEFSFDIELI